MKVVRQSIIVALSHWGVVPIGILTSVIVARSLGPEGIGIIALLTAMVTLFRTIGEFGFTESFIYYYKKGIYPFTELISARLFVTIFYSSMVFLLAAIFRAQFYDLFFHDLKGYEASGLWIYLALFALPLLLLTKFFSQLFIVDGHMKLHVGVRIGSSVSGLLSIILFLFVFKLGITGALLSALIVDLFPLCVLWQWLKKKQIRFSLRFSRKVLIDLFHTGGRQYSVSLFAIITKRIAVFLIAMLLSVTYNGFYAIAQKMMDYLLEVSRSSMWPLVGNLATKEPAAQEISLARAIRVLLFAMIVMCVGTGILAYPMIYFLFGRRFLLAVSTLWLCLPAIVTSGIVIPGNAYYNSIGQPGRIVTYLVPTTIIYLVLLFLLIPILDIRGVAIALSAKDVALAGCYIYLLRKKLRISLKNLLIIKKEDIGLIREYLIGRFVRKRVMAEVS